jgi:hypothetical protein
MWKNRVDVAFVLTIAATTCAACGPRVQAPDPSDGAQQVPAAQDEPATSAAEPTETADQPAGNAGAPDPCAPALTAVAQLWKARNPGAGNPTFEGATGNALDGDHDFNGDGTADCAVGTGGPERWLFLTAHPGEAPTFVGTVIADDLFGFSCLSNATNGLCDISASQRMIHGETQIRRYAFDGKVYRQTSVRLTAPHPKFGP